MKILFFLSLAVCGATARGQGTLIYDQQSLSPNGGEGGVYLSALQQGVQSFTPTMPGIDFASFWFLQGNSALHVNIRETSITGPILGTTPDVAGSASGPLTFFFPTTVQLTPGTLYYLELVPVNGGVTVSYGWSGQTYAGGVGYINGQPITQGADFWFREGIVSVPEPTTFSLLILGACAGLWLRFRREA
jgi:hypothetical protein